MSTYAVKKIDDMEAIFGGAFKRARAELGVESFGMQIIDMPPSYENYPEHDHTHDNQEEEAKAQEYDQAPGRRSRASGRCRGTRELIRHGTPSASERENLAAAAHLLLDRRLHDI